MVEDEYAALNQPSAPTDGGGFVAFVPGLPGCISDGETAKKLQMRFPNGSMKRSGLAAKSERP